MIRSPIIVDAKSEVLLFSSVEAAEAYLEVIDVQNGEYPVAYDSEGRRFEVTTKTLKFPFLFGLIQLKRESASLQPTDDGPSHGLELRELLRAHLPKNDDTDASVQSLEALLAIAAKRSFIR